MWRAHPRKSWMGRSWRSTSGDGRMTVALVWIYFRPPSKNTCRLWRPDAMQTFQIFRPKVSPTLPQNIRHAATALTGMGYSVAASFGTFLCIRHADKKRHIDRTVPHHLQHRRLWCAWLRDLCGGVAAILREMRWNFKNIQIKYCV